MHSSQPHAGGPDAALGVAGVTMWLLYGCGLDPLHCVPHAAHSLLAALPVSPPPTWLCLASVQLRTWPPAAHQLPALSPCCRYDIAVVQFSTNIGNKVGWMGMSTAGHNGPLNTAGYPGDKPFGTEW